VQKLDLYQGICPLCDKSFSNDYKVKRHIVHGKCTITISVCKVPIADSFFKFHYRYRYLLAGLRIRIDLIPGTDPDLAFLLTPDPDPFPDADPS
jgi:hypothetical protein